PALMQPMMTTRPFSLWRIPLYWATASKWKRRATVLGSLSGLTFIGAVLGPAFWLVLGGVGTVVTWRMWRQTKRWWQLLSPGERVLASITPQEGIMQLLRRQIGGHEAAQQVQQKAIDTILEWAHTDHGRRVLVNDLNVSRVDGMTFFPPHASSVSSQTMIVNGNRASGEQIHVEFWAEDDRSVHPRSGSCCVYVDALVDPSGQIQLKDVRLAAPGWHADEHVPL
ncbi:hypothetical protein BJV82DRAFT_494796, partial [Fennellomyces sp. T-0311]